MKIIQFKPFSENEKLSKAALLCGIEAIVGTFQKRKKSAFTWLVLPKQMHFISLNIFRLNFIPLFAK
jgi:hypothetical protein